MGRVGAGGGARVRAGSGCGPLTEARDDVAGVLDQLVQVGEVMTTRCVRVIQVGRKVAECVENGHI